MAATSTNGTKAGRGDIALRGTKGGNVAARVRWLVRRGVLAIPLLMEIAEDEEEGDEDDGLNRSDEGEIIGQMATILLDGE